MIFIGQWTIWCISQLQLHLEPSRFCMFKNIFLDVFLSLPWNLHPDTLPTLCGIDPGYQYTYEGGSHL